MSLLPCTIKPCHTLVLAVSRIVTSHERSEGQRMGKMPPVGTGGVLGKWRAAAGEMLLRA